MNSSFLARVEMAPRDPILGLTELFNSDSSSRKVNLGVGVYYDDDGKVPLLQCVRRAEQQLAEKPSPRAYLPIDGLPAYDKAVQELVFGRDCEALAESRVVTVQALGGTGALKIGADFLRRLLPDAQVWISDPSWENHRGLFENAGYRVNTYPYYDPKTREVNFAGMIAALEKIPSNSILILHACCHNPTGVDLSVDQWAEVLRVVGDRSIVPFLDIAYQGLGDGLDADSLAVRRFVHQSNPVFVSNSFSKSFSLYGERVGALSIVSGSTDEAARVLSQLKRIVRTNYSNPPTHGGQIVATVLNTPELRSLWETELKHMRDRIRLMRVQLVDRIRARAPDANFDFVLRQRGMFSYSGLTAPQVQRLRAEFSVYAIESGRICVAALNSANLDYVADSIAKVIQ